MGSRRARRSHGRVQQAFPIPRQKQKQPGAAKLIRKSNRTQHKAAILTAARAARNAARADAPILVALFPLTGTSDAQIDMLASALRSTEVDRAIPSFETLSMGREGKTSREALIAALDTAKVADIVLLVFTGREDMDDEAVELLCAMRSQGLPTIFPVAIGAGAEDPDLRKLRGRQLAAESLGEDHSLRPVRFDVGDSSNEAGVNKMAVRRIFGKAPRAVSWRARYGYMRVETVSLESTQTGDENLILSGWVRGRGFTADELVHLTGFGSYAVERVVDVMNGKLLSVRGPNGEPVESEAEVDGIMGEQTWPPEIDDATAEHENESDDEGGENSDQRQILAKEFDAIADEDDKADEEKDEVAMKDINVEEDDGESKSKGSLEDIEMAIDETEVKRVRQEAKRDMEFPDEVDTPIDQPARMRFARYRGLKSLRTGEWDPKEQLPDDYAKLFQFRNLAATRKRVLQASKRDAEQAVGNTESNFVLSGKKVHLKLIDIPVDIKNQIIAYHRAGKAPLVASGMLRHENKRSVVHFAVQRVDEDVEGSEIKAKTHMEMHSGFVRFEGRPMFSENNVNSEKHKMERFLKHHRLTVASFYGPSVFAPAPALLCFPGGSLVACGNALGADPDRIILKRIILTGYPFKTQKRRSVAKFMFFNPEDVRWFKPIELWTKLGRTGHILEPIGTHGHMKCIFDGVVLHHDTVCMTLYKRVYPKVVQREDQERQKS